MPKNLQQFMGYCRLSPRMGSKPVKKSHGEGSNKGAMTTHHIAFELLKHQIAFCSFKKESRKMYPDISRKLRCVRLAVAGADLL